MDDATDLHRLIWSPDDIQEGRLLTSAFPRQDLQDAARYVSVSRTDKLNPEAEILTAQNQADKADGVNFRRDEAWSAILNCGEVRSLEDTEGNQPFAVKPEPIIGVNEAHCGISNVTSKRGRGYVNQLRALLVRAASKLRTLDEFLGEI